ncbi:MAG: methyltransferase domain-containing protein [Pseudomonadales bacterium]|jgi:SAM-dependent methyltransferase|nr:methyltransferase domain-containing protein [Pseudomonadales bacterium]
MRSEAAGAVLVPEGTRCPVCGNAALHGVLDLGEVPVFCNVQADSREAARAAPTAPFRLAGCARCGHSFNAAFRPDRVEYAPAYDSSQHHSETFRAYADALATRLVETHGVRDGAVVDVGCGKGDLLKRICRAGGNRGFGFDASYEGDPRPADAAGVEFHTEFFDAALAGEIAPQLICCRHVLEHVADPLAFLRELGRALAAAPGSVLYLEVPNGALQLERRLLWDYIYEHFSYFSAASLRLALEAAGLEVLRLETGFGEQFLCADVRLREPPPGPVEADPASPFEALMAATAADFTERLDAWRRWRDALPEDPDATVLWGAGSKGVTFVNLLELVVPGPVSRIVDQNPNKHGRFVARTGQEIVAPEALRAVPPSQVVVMNAIYAGEISGWLAEREIRAELLDAMGAPPS